MHPVTVPRGCSGGMSSAAAKKSQVIYSKVRSASFVVYNGKSISGL